MRRGYEAWYLVVAGRFWIRSTVVGGETALWLVSFAGTRSARKETAPRAGPGELTSGRIAGARWELSLEPLAGPADPVPRLLRPLSKTRFVLSAPALLVSGFVEVDGVRHELEHAPGHQGHVCGSRHADRFGWAHASHADGRWVDLLVARGLGLANGKLSLRGKNAPGRLEAGRFTVEAARETFVGVTYHDPDGTPLYCYHSERGRLRGPGFQTDEAALEYASRARVPGWPVAL
jgi:hypothetical protein